MVSNDTETVLITRNSAEASKPGRVYITGPHFGNAFSSTRDRAEASRFTRADAENYLAHGKWANLLPTIEED